jgi:hypothetical protein
MSEIRLTEASTWRTLRERIKISILNIYSENISIGIFDDPLQTPSPAAMPDFPRWRITC